MLGDKKIKIRVGGDFDPVPMDKYTVQITDVNVVTQYNQWKGAEQEMLKYEFTILDEKPMEEGDETTRGRLLWGRYSPSLGARSNLGKLVVAVFGRELTKEEMEDFDPESIIGQQVDAMVEQQPSKDGTQIYNNILSVSKNLKPLKAVEKKAAEKAGPIQKKTVPAVAPAPTTDEADDFINQAEKEAEEAKNKVKAKPAAPAAPVATPEPVEADEEVDPEVALLEAEEKAAELAVRKAKAIAEAARKKAALKANATA